MCKCTKSDTLPLLSILFGILNIGLFYFWFKIAKCCFFVQKEWCDPIAIQFGIMNIMLICVSIFLVVIGFLGYGGVKTIAKDKAKEIAENVANSQMSEFFTKQEEGKQKERGYANPPPPQNNTTETNKNNREESV